MPGEKFDNFLNDLKKLTRNCNFGSFKDILIKDRIVSGIHDNRERTDY